MQKQSCLMALLFLLPSLAFADAASDLKDQQAQAACDKYWDHNAASDPCSEADLLEKGAHVQLAAGVVYSVAATDCLIECFAPFSGGIACKAGSFAGMGTDLIGTIAVGAAGGKVAQNLASGLPMIGGQIMAMTQLKDTGFYGGAAADSATVTKESADEAAKSGKDTAAKQGDKAACIEAAMDGVQATVRYINFATEMAQARTARLKKLEMMGNNATMNIGNGSSSGSINSGTGSGTPQGTPTAQRGSTEKSAEAPSLASKLASSAESAGYGPLLKNFQDTTGKPIGGMLNNVANGMPPLLAAADAASEQLGDKGLSAAAELHQAGQVLAEKNRDALEQLDKKSGLAAAFEPSGAVRRSPASASHSGSGMPDVGALMAGLLGKKPGAPAAPQGVSGLTFGAKPERMSAEGFHAPDRSLFDVVGLRYRNVTNRFLGGEALVGAQTSLLPSNPYISK